MVINKKLVVGQGSLLQQVADIFQQFTLSLGEEETKDFI